jgi:hypothetical protein
LTGNFLLLHSVYWHAIFFCSILYIDKQFSEVTETHIGNWMNSSLRRDMKIC